jgi:hypothetical protein
MRASIGPERRIVMPGFDGSGPRGNGPMRGGGMGYCVIPLNTREQELVYLKSQARVLGAQLKQIKARIQELERVKTIAR